MHIDFGFMLSNTPGNLGFEAAPFKLPMEYVDVLGGIEGAPFLEFRKLFREGFEAARKHCDRIVSKSSPVFCSARRLSSISRSAGRTYAKRLDIAMLHRPWRADGATAA